MAEQLDFLAAAARRPHIVLQVIPLSAGAHEGMRGGPFVLADFADSPSLGYQDTAVAGQIVEGENQVEALATTLGYVEAGGAAPERIPRACEGSG